MSSVREPGDSAGQFSDETGQLAGRLVEWYLDVLTRTYSAKIVNDAMSTTTDDVASLCFSSRLRKSLPLGAHVIATALPRIPRTKNTDPLIMRQSKWAVTFYQIHSLVALANSANQHSAYGQYWLKQAFGRLQDLWREIEDYVREGEARKDTIGEIECSAKNGDPNAQQALSWFLEWRQRNSPSSKDFWRSLLGATPSYQHPDPDVISAEQRSWAEYERESLRTPPATPSRLAEASPSDGGSSPVAATDAAMAELNKLIGLGAVKQQVKDLTDYLRLQAMRKSQGLKTPDIALHFVLKGPPGTGKTTVARLLGQILAALGLLPDGHVVETSRQDLVAGYIGQTAIKANEVIDKALGGVLFIDEAYTLAPENPDKDFGQEAIEVLLKRMEDDRDHLVVIAAGYSAEMDRFMAANPGLASRFTRTIEFADYTPDELARVMDTVISNSGYQLSPVAQRAAKQVIEEAWQRRTRTFGNGRMVRNLAEEAIMKQATRLSRGDLDALEPQALSLIEPEDIPGFTRQAGSLEDVLRELDVMIGLAGVKQQVRSLTDFVALQLHRQELGLQAADISRHLVFTGPPGTGKTTVARLIGKIYAALGLLADGHVIEASRQDLVAGYVGQTAIKTNKLIDRALGGVLFIDEAYTLAAKGSAREWDFGREAIDTLLKRMEDDRASFAVIVAGYPQEMEEFLNTNPGLASRLPRTITFPDYTPDELMEIFTSMITERGYFIGDRTRKHATDLITAKWAARDARFGNARFVRNLVDDAILRQATRLGPGSGSELAVMTKEELSELIEADMRLDANE